MTGTRMDLFRKLSGDENPMHVDDQYATERGFPGRLVYGMLTSSFYSTLVGVYLPGRYCLLHEISIKFTKPVSIGDVLTVSGRVAGKFDAYQILEIKARIMNQHSQTVSRAVVKVGVLDGK